MGEIIKSSGDRTGKDRTLCQIELVREISKISSVLSLGFTEGMTSRLENIKFSKPPSELLGWSSTSGLLDSMVEQSTVLNIRQYSLPERNDKEVPQAACNVWEINPPQEDEHLPGFGLTVVIPQLAEGDLINLDKLRKTGSLHVVSLVWFENGETSYNPTSPKNELLNTIMRRSLDRLRLAKWILEGLQTSRQGNLS